MAVASGTEYYKRLIDRAHARLESCETLANHLPEYWVVSVVTVIGRNLFRL